MWFQQQLKRSRLLYTAVKVGELQGGHYLHAHAYAELPQYLNSACLWLRRTPLWAAYLCEITVWCRYSPSSVRCVSKSSNATLASGGLLAGKRCLVAGGSRGIGKAIAETFAREGASLALLARNKDKLEEVCMQYFALAQLLKMHSDLLIHGTCSLDRLAFIYIQ